MKILEATTIIAIVKEINCPSLFDKIIQLKHDLVIPNYVFSEILDKKSVNICKKMISKGELKISNLNSLQEIDDFQKTYPYLGKGEVDSMLHFQKLSKKHKVYCIIDDGRARKVAKSKNINFTGLLGLLKILNDRKILNNSEYDNIIYKLKKSNFRIPEEFVK